MSNKKDIREKKFLITLKYESAIRGKDWCISKQIIKGAIEDEVPFAKVSVVLFKDENSHQGNLQK